MANRHISGEVCPLCEDKLKDSHPTLVFWFRKIKSQFKDCHISWTFRDEKWQNWAYDNKKSKLRWPNSKHNKMKDGKPESQAMDLFQLRADKLAGFAISYFRAIYAYLSSQNASVTWGGLWKQFPDGDHFEIKDLS